VKGSLLRSGVPRADAAIARLHFPQLSEAAIQSLSGRRATGLLKVLKRKSFMQGWDIRMRYASTGSVRQEQAERWRDDANAAIGELF